MEALSPHSQSGETFNEYDEENYEIDLSRGSRWQLGNRDGEYSDEEEGEFYGSQSSASASASAYPSWLLSPRQKLLTLSRLMICQRVVLSVILGILALLLFVVGLVLAIVPLLVFASVTIGVVIGSRLTQSTDFVAALTNDSSEHQNTNTNTNTNANTNTNNNTNTKNNINKNNKSKKNNNTNTNTSTNTNTNTNTNNNTNIDIDNLTDVEMRDTSSACSTTSSAKRHHSRLGTTHKLNNISKDEGAWAKIWKETKHLPR